MTPRPPRSTLFPYTTLFRSCVATRPASRARGDVVVVGGDLVPVRGDQLSAAGLVLRLPAGEPPRALDRDHGVARHGRPRCAAPRAPVGPPGGVARSEAPELHT